jgi:hypothetical protein
VQLQHEVSCWSCLPLSPVANFSWRQITERWLTAFSDNDQSSRCQGRTTCVRARSYYRFTFLDLQRSHSVRSTLRGKRASLHFHPILRPSHRCVQNPHLRHAKLWYDDTESKLVMSAAQQLNTEAEPGWKPVISHVQTFPCCKDHGMGRHAEKPATDPKGSVPPSPHSR